MPAAEVEVDVELVRDLLSEQHPDLAELPLTLVANGWDNAVYRLGDDMSVRLPRRQLGADLVANETRWLPEVAERLPLPVPVPLHVGDPARGYPWRWTICRWIDGEVAATSVLDLGRAAVALGEFVAAMCAPAPPDAPYNPYRGVPLAERESVTSDRIEQLRDQIPAATLQRAWEEALAVPVFAGAPRWLHGDLHPANMVAVGGRISGVIDFGDITAGDPATDLSVAWMLFDGPDRTAFRAAAGDPDDDTWARARGWAISLAVAYIANSADNPLIAGIGTRTVERVLSE